MAVDRRLRVPHPLSSWQELNRRVSGVTGGLLDIVSGWVSTSPNGDWTPTGDGQWVGDGDNPVEGVAFGRVTGDPDLPGIEGATLERSGSSDGAGGLALVGYKAEAVPSAPITDPGLLANAPVEISGVPVLLMGGVAVEVGAAQTDEFYLILGETTQLADGRHIAPLLIGPQYQPSYSEEATDTRDIPLDGAGGVETVVTLGPLTNAYAPTVSTFLYEIRLAEERGRQSDFTVEIWHQPSGGSYGLVFEDDYSLTGQAQNISQSIVLQAGIGAGDNLQMRVYAVDTHPQSDPWVRGSVRASRLELRQG